MVASIAAYLIAGLIVAGVCRRFRGRPVDLVFWIFWTLAWPGLLMLATIAGVIWLLTALNEVLGRVKV